MIGTSVAIIGKYEGDDMKPSIDVVNDWLKNSTLRLVTYYVKQKKRNFSKTLLCLNVCKTLLLLQIMTSIVFSMPLMYYFVMLRPEWLISKKPYRTARL